MKRFYLLIFAVFSILSVSAQSNGKRIAVFDPTSSGTSVNIGTKTAIREIISSTIVNAGGYNIVERSMLEKVMQEQSFSNSGVVDDGQATEIGKLAGANKVIVSVITSTGGKNMLSIKMIDVKTASVERQQVKVVAANEILEVVESMTMRLVEPDKTVVATDDDEEEVVFYQSQHKDVQMPRLDEILFYLPEGYKVEKEKDRDQPLIVKLGNEIIGSGTLSSGFNIRIKNYEPGTQELRIGSMKLDINTERYNYFEFQIYRKYFLGKVSYGISVKEMKKIE